MNKKLNLAILGAGGIAGHMANTVNKMKEARLYAVGSRDLGRAEAFAKQYGAKKAYGSYEELVEDEKVDLVYIATPHSEHYAHALLCLHHDKPVLCEKAFTVNSGQARELVALAQKKNVLLAEALWPRYMPLLKTIKKTLKSGVIGEPQILTANLGYSIAHVDRLVNPELAGGALLDLGVYTINFAAMVFGTKIKKIDATAIMADSGVDAQNNITLTYEDGRMAVLTSTMRGMSDRKGIVYGTKGFMIVENINNFESLSVYDNNYQKVAFYKRPKQITGYEYEVAACIKALGAGKIECKAMPHKEIIKMMGIMDEIRGQWGLKYPFE
ncbi:MAG: Gfo/Idh/MocA family oxidoreductase [Lachnospiraceae bacterium]|jgi:predicted dehydrogenase|nr:Gfo/Idh/MocA family oxidoreductase [Lachnospiraceae bacterium]